MIPPVKLGIALTGHYRVEKRKKSGDVIYETEFDNIVLDIGWENFKARLDGAPPRTQKPVPKYLFLGTGTSEPQETDTGLEQVSQTLAGKGAAGTSLVGESFSGGVGKCHVDMTFNYGEGEAEGVWSELGLSYTSDYTMPYNRSLIRDDAGNPITLTILSDEYLTVYVRLSLYLVQPSAESSIITYNGQDHTVTWEMTSNIVSEIYSSGCMPWASGFPHRLSISGVGVYGLAYEGNLLYKTTADKVIEPGSEITISGGVLQTWYYSTYDPRYLTTASFSIDPVITIPADHKTTVTGPHSVQWSRVPVPQEPA